MLIGGQPADASRVGHNLHEASRRGHTLHPALPVQFNSVSSVLALPANLTMTTLSGHHCTSSGRTTCRHEQRSACGEKATTHPCHLNHAAHHTALAAFIVRSIVAVHSSSHEHLLMRKAMHCPTSQLPLQRTLSGHFSLKNVREGIVEVVAWHDTPVHEVLHALGLRELVRRLHPTVPEAGDVSARTPENQGPTRLL